MTGENDQVDEHNVIQISRRVMPWFTAAFRTQALGERISWDAVFAAGQTPEGTMAPVFLIFAEMPAVQLGRQHTVFAQLVALGLGEPAVDQAVAGVIARLHEMRRAELTVVNGRHG